MQKCKKSHPFGYKKITLLNWLKNGETEANIQ